MSKQSRVLFIALLFSAVPFTLALYARGGYSAPLALQTGTLPSPWVTQDVGTVGVVGTADHADGTFTIEGSGVDIWKAADSFRFVYQPVAGDVSIVARVTGLEYTNAWAKAGVMIRESLAPDSRNVALVVTTINGLGFQQRTATGALTTHTGSPGAAPQWIKLERRGNTYSAYKSADGSAWELIGSGTFEMSGSVYVGLAVTSHNNTTLCTGVFDNVTVSGGGAPGGSPGVVSTTPAPGATAVPVGANVTATFSEPVQSSTISFVLRDPAGATVPAAASYDSATRTATLDPSALLLGTATFTATVGGAMDLDGNVMAAPVSWSFTTETPTVGFKETIVFSGLTNPMTVRFSPDGRVFVAEKSGLIKVFDSISDQTPTTFADLRTKVYNFWDRGLLGMALHPDFPAAPYIYVLYTHDAEIGGAAPRWGSPGGTSDPCPNPPGATGDGCVCSGRLSRLEAAGNVMTGEEVVLIEDWFQQYPSHSVGSLQFGADGALYVSGGDGASFNFVDYGQDGNPTNPGGDPPVPVGGVQVPPTAEGGALRSQDLRTSGDPVTLDGAILRLDPTTGAAMQGNPLLSSTDPNARRIIAYGLRNPFRFTVRPGTNELWVADVGWNIWEEINRIPDPADQVVENFGWPCYEGSARQSGYDGANLNLCENLYAESGAATSPYFKYSHGAPVVPGENDTGTASLSGIAFYTGGSYPAGYEGALFFADYSRNRIWVMFKGANGAPDPANVRTFVTNAASPVELQTGPGGDLFYVDHGGTIRRISYVTANQGPTAVISAAPLSGSAPLTVNFDCSGSSDPNAGDTLICSWDFEGDGTFDVTAAQTAHTYTVDGSYNAVLRVTDSAGLTDTDTALIEVGNTAPAATIVGPLATTLWAAGDVINFTGHASDQEDGLLPPAALSWAVILHHCATETNCHEHQLQTFDGVDTGSFSAPDHEYPAHLEIRLTATDSGGLRDAESVRLDPKTVILTFQSSPAGLQLVVGSSGATAPFTRPFIVNSMLSASAPSPQNLGGYAYNFMSWSDGGAQAHTITAPASPVTYTAAYALAPAPPPAPSSLSASAGSMISLSWSDNSINEDGFRIERSTDGSRFTEIATVGAGVTRYTDPNPSRVCNTFYYYRVRAYNSFGASSYTNTAKAKTTKKCL